MTFQGKGVARDQPRVVAADRCHPALGADHAGTAVVEAGALQRHAGIAEQPAALVVQRGHARYDKYSLTLSYLQPFQLWGERFSFDSLATGQRSNARYDKYSLTLSYLQPFQLWGERFSFDSLATGQRSTALDNQGGRMLSDAGVTLKGASLDNSRSGVISAKGEACGETGGQARGENRSREARSQAGGEACGETGGQAEMEAAPPATPRHTMFPLWLLPSGPDQVDG